MIRSVAADGRPDLGGIFTPLERARVVDRIAAAARYRIAAVIAPAGFGKSVAIRQFLRTVPAAIVYDVPRDAVALVPFVRGFVEALAAHAPLLAATLSTALHGIAGSPAPGAELAAWMRGHLSAVDALVVIDDVHHGEADAEIGRFLTALIDGRDAPGVRWLLSSRSAAKLPLASWLAYGEMDLIVDAVDLRFTADEARASAKAARVAVRDEELRAILDLVEGWPTALTFALRTSTRAADLLAVAASTREMVYRYLAEQVYRSLDDGTRAFLRFAALLPELDVRFAIAGGFDDAYAVIERLRERVAFITAVDRGRFRLQDLFRDFIRHQIALEGAHALAGELRRVASVLERELEYAAALERYIEAAAGDDVARVLALAGFGLFASGHADVVERALASVPRATVNRDPDLLAVRGALEEHHGRSDAAEAIYKTVLGGKPSSTLRRRVALRLARLYADAAKPESAPLLREALQDDDAELDERCELHGMLAVAHGIAGDLDGARREIDRALELSEIAADETRARILGRAAGIAMIRRDDADVERFGAESLRLATASGRFSIAARTYSLLASNTLWDPARRAQTLWYAQQSTICGAKSGDMRAWTGGLLQQMELEVERGNGERLDALASEFDALGAFGGSGTPLAHRFARAIQCAWRGDFTAAHQILLGVPGAGLEPSQRYQRFVRLGLLFAADNRRNDAIGALAAAAGERDGVDPNFPPFFNAVSVGERIAALANIVLGRRTLALRALRGFARTPGLEGFDAALRAAATDDAGTLADAFVRMSQEHFGGYRRLIAAVGDEFVALPAGRPDALTGAELDVLRAMASGRSNKDIAEEQRRTVNTIRTHVSAVLRKLQARNRGEAVAAARRLELI